MKFSKILIASILIFIATTAQAQVTVNVNIGSPPPWGPAGYSQIRYYYLPDVQAYYDVQTSMFIYFGSGVWLHRTYLPTRYRNYDLYGGYKVVMSDYRGNTPYIHYKEHKAKYGRGYHGPAQKTIGNRPEKGNKKKGYSKDRSDNNSNRNKGKSENRDGRNNKQKGGGHGGEKGHKK